MSAAAPCCGRGAFVARRWASPFAVAAVRCVAPVALPVVPSSALPVSVLGCRARLSPPSPPGGLAVRRCVACDRVKGRETQLDLALRARSQTGPRLRRGLPDSRRPRLPAGPQAEDLRVKRVVLLAAIFSHCSAAARSFVLVAGSAGPNGPRRSPRAVPSRLREDVLASCCSGTSAPDQRPCGKRPRHRSR